MKFKLYINYLSEPYQRVWILETNRKKYILKSIFLSVPVSTIFRGKDSKQPKAYLEGNGKIKIKGRKGLVI